MDHTKTFYRNLKPFLKKPPILLARTARKVFIGFIILYQKILSPDHSIFARLNPYGFCRFYPSCSEYTKEAIIRQGILRGGLRGILRIFRCNPWSKGGVDLL